MRAEIVAGRAGTAGDLTGSTAGPTADPYEGIDVHVLHRTPSGTPIASTATASEARPSPRYRAAIAVYGGELLPEAAVRRLGGAPHRRFLRHAHLDALKRLTLLCRDDGDLFEASWTAQLGLLVDDLDDELVESLAPHPRRSAGQPPAHGGVGRATRPAWRRSSASRRRPTLVALADVRRRALSSYSP